MAEVELREDDSGESGEPGWNSIDFRIDKDGKLER